jgi:glucose/mannose-6-phosphate isomerase
MGLLLDDLEKINQIDLRGMLSVINAIPESAEEAIVLAENVKLKVRHFRNLVIAGMGGSAIGGLLLRDWLQQATKVPIVISRDYSIPGFVGKDTLLFAVSYSGGTEETLSAFEEGKARGAKIVVFTSGGELEKRARANRVTVYKLPSGFQPRAAIAHQFLSLVVAARKVGIAEDSWWEVREAIDVLKVLREENRPEVSQGSNPAKKLATELYGYVPFIYGSRIHEAVAYRWSTQLNENGKSPAGSSFIPEAFHNAIVASEADKELLKKVCAVFLLDPAETEHLKAKTRRLIEIMKPCFGKVLEVEASGEGRLARMLSALYFGDFVSTYLGLLYGKDPSTVESIDRLKRS